MTNTNPLFGTVGDVLDHKRRRQSKRIRRSNTEGKPILFKLGQIVSTPQARDDIHAAGKSIGHYLRRHNTGDWGDLTASDKKANDDALKYNDRIFSAYDLPDEADTRIWIITEWDRSVTTVMLPEEY